MKIKEVAEGLYQALKKASDHLDYCGYGDSWESECAEAQNLSDIISKALNAYREMANIKTKSEIEELVKRTMVKIARNTDSKIQLPAICNPEIDCAKCGCKKKKDIYCGAILARIEDLMGYEGYKERDKIKAEILKKYRMED